MFEQVRRFLRKIPKFFAKVFAYSKLLWHDEDWDYDYLLHMLKYKLSRMKTTIESNNLIAPEEINKIKSEIDATVKHIDNYMDTESVFGEFEIPYSFKAVPYSGTTSSKGNAYTFKLTRKDTGEFFTEEEDAKYCKYLEDMNAFKQQEWNAIFDSMKEHAQSWWG